MKSGLSIRSLKKEYVKGVPVLKELDLEIPSGSFVSLLGPSGCGKSTVLWCLAGLTNISGGQIHFEGNRLDTVPPQKRNVGMVFQNYALFPHLSAFDNVAFGLKIKGMAKSEVQNKVNEALRMLRLSEFSHRFPGELSGGQQQRLAFARTIVMEPKLLLLDEPLSNLDAKLREELKLEIKRLHQRLNITMVHVTHDQSEAMSLSDVIVLLNAGEVEQIGSPEELYFKPRTKFVADFFGYRNLFQLTVTKCSAQDIVFSLADLTFTVPTEVLDKEQLEYLVHRVGKKVVCALRPSDLSLGGHEANHFRVDLCEYQGQNYLLTGTVGSQHLTVASLSAQAPGDKKSIDFNWNQARFYDAH